MNGIKQLFMLGALAIGVAGCQAWSLSAEKLDQGYQLKDNVFDFEGLPDRQFLVGGGYFIVYRAAAEGDLYLADDASDRLLATVSLQAGEEHEMIYDISDEKLAANLESLGIDPKKAAFKLYFVPR